MQHALFWAVASAFFLLDDRIETSLRASLGLAAGIACIAAMLAIVSAPESDSGGLRLRRAVYFAVAGFVLGILSLHGAYIWTFGDLQAPAVQAVLQTDIAEALGYIASNLLVPWAAFWSASLLLLWLTYPETREPWIRLRLAVPVLVVGAAGFLWLGRSAVSEPIEVVKSYREGIQELREAAAWWSRNPAPPASSDLDATVILVLGESTSRHHMALYGYPRNTTPILSALRSELAVFNDVISSHSSTVESLVPALTVPVSASPAGAHLERPISILQLANAAGFETHWLSNQNEFGVWDSPVRILAQQARNVRYHDRSLGRIMSRRVFDDALLPSLDQALATPAPRKLIVLHLMSTHLPYCWTKPPDFNPLPAAETGKRFYGRKGTLRHRIGRAIGSRGSTVGCYDNGVRYVDHVLGGVLDRAKQLSGPAAVVYLSDHGEAPLLGTNHDGAVHSAYHIEVPLLLWANASYRDARPDVWRSALENQAKPFSLALLTPTMAGLLALETSLVKDEDNLLDSAYRPRPRRALDGTIRYDEQSKANDYRENSRVFVRRLGPVSDRVWAHRVNTLGSLLEAKRTFSGIELDVHFNDRTGRFEVRHEYRDIGLDLRDILEWSRDRPNLKIWIDWKNATAANVRSAVAELTRLDREFALKSRTLVETDPDAVSPALVLISNAGFKRGYYLPIERIEAAMEQGPAATGRLAAEIERVVVRGRFDAITYDASLHPFVHESLGRFLEEQGIERYSWALSIDAGDPATNADAVRATIRNWKLEALLVTFPSDFRI